jgi:hypothetical protein
MDCDGYVTAGIPTGDGCDGCDGFLKNFQKETFNPLLGILGKASTILSTTRNSKPETTAHKHFLR